MSSQDWFGLIFGQPNLQAESFNPAAFSEWENQKVNVTDASCSVNRNVYGWRLLWKWMKCPLKWCKHDSVCVMSCQGGSGESGLIGVNSPSVCVSQQTGSLADTSPATGEAERGLTIPHLLSSCLLVLISFLSDPKASLISYLAKIWRPWCKTCLRFAWINFEFCEFYLCNYK